MNNPSSVPWGISRVELLRLHINNCHLLVKTCPKHFIEVRIGVFSAIILGSISRYPLVLGTKKTCSAWLWHSIR